MMANIQQSLCGRINNNVDLIGKVSLMRIRRRGRSICEIFLLWKISESKTRSLLMVFPKGNKSISVKSTLAPAKGVCWPHAPPLSCFSFGTRLPSAGGIFVRKLCRFCFQSKIIAFILCSYSLSTDIVTQTDDRLDQNVRRWPPERSHSLPATRTNCRRLFRFWAFFQVRMSDIQSTY